VDNAYRSDEENPYTLAEHFMSFTDAIWADVFSKQAPTDSFQRAIQSVYVDLLIQLATDESPDRVSDAAAMAYSELARIDKAISDLLVEGVKDPLAKAHLLEVRHRIRGVIDTEQ
jgi:hypothetical protein